MSMWLHHVLMLGNSSLRCPVHVPVTTDKERYSQQRACRELREADTGRPAEELKERQELFKFLADNHFQR